MHRDMRGVKLGLRKLNLEVYTIQSVMAAFDWLVTTKTSREDWIDAISLLMHC